MKTDYTRDELISICERAIVPVGRWRDRDTPNSQAKVGMCWAYLKAGCPFKVLTEGDLRTNERTIWLWINHPSFMSMDAGEPDADGTYYLPTPKRLEQVNGGDWY